MKVTQIYEILNEMVSENLGEENVLLEDLSNIVSIGKEFASVIGVDNYVKKLTDKVGKMIFVNRVYEGRLPSVLMDGWQYGSIVEKVSGELPQAEENSAWSLADGATYDTNKFYEPKVSVSLWNDRVTFSIPISITEMQVMSSFNSAEQMNSFLSMIYNDVNNAMTLNIDILVMRTINNMISLTYSSEYGTTDPKLKSGTRAVNLLYLYNQATGTWDDSGATPVFTPNTLTADLALVSLEFLKFASATMAKYIDRMKVMTTLFNINGKQRFTPKSRLNVAMLSDFKINADMYLQSDTFHEQYTALPNAETVTFWQGSGIDFSFDEISKINVKNSNGETTSISGILAVMYDRDSLGVTNMNPRVTTHYVASAEFWNEWHKWDAGYFNDTNENCVIFFIQ